MRRHPDALPAPGAVVTPCGDTGPRWNAHPFAEISAGAVVL